MFDIIKHHSQTKESIKCTYFIHESFVAIFLLYAKLEEEHGLARHAMAVYDRATKAVLPEEQYEVENDFLYNYKLWFFVSVCFFLLYFMKYCTSTCV